MRREFDSSGLKEFVLTPGSGPTQPGATSAVSSTGCAGVGFGATHSPQLGQNLSPSRTDALHFGQCDPSLAPQSAQ
jgi:hypothetical protein